MIEKFERYRSLKEFTTLGIGGPAEYFIEVGDIPTMQKVLLFCKQEKLPYFILGKGSNIIFDDRGFFGLVIANRIHFCEQTAQDKWHVGAGYSFSLLGSQTARLGWSGLEFASGIPGSVGGAVYMNAGANGYETCQALTSVDFVNSKGELISFPKEELTFSYRTSPFQKKEGVIVSATFQLHPSIEARQKQLDIVQYRKKTQPYHAKSAGCFFRNHTCTAAGAIIERCGLKGKKIGGAEVSTLHANFVINSHHASSADLLNLIELIRQEVKTQTDIDLTLEVQYIPYKL